MPSKRGVMMWMLMAFFCFFQFFMQLSGNLMASGWQESFHLSESLTGFLSSSFFYGYIAVQVPAGFLFDACGMKKVIRLAVAVFVLGILLFAGAPSLTLGLLGRLMMGAGAGFAFVGMVYATATWFSSSQFTLFVGLGEMLSMALTALGQAVAPHFILEYGWRPTLFTLAGVGLVFALLIWSFLENPPEYKTKQLRIWPLFKLHAQTVIKVKNVWRTGLIACGFFSVISVFASLWGNQYLQARYHLDYVSASHYIALIPLGFGLGCPILGLLNDRLISNRLLLQLSAFILFGLTLTMMGQGNSPIILSLCLFLMGTFGGGTVLSFYSAQKSISPPFRGIAIGLCNTLVIAGAIIFQPLIGWIWPHYGLHALWVFPILLLGCALLTLPPFECTGKLDLQGTDGLLR